MSPQRAPIAQSINLRPCSLQISVKERMQDRLSDQASELEAKRELERVLQQAQVILENRLAEQTTELRQTRGELPAAKTKKS
jgi:hypothetical protein